MLPAPVAQRDQRDLNMNFKVLKFLGKGSYGSVFQVQRLSDMQTYALKEMDVRSMSQAEREDSANEIRLLASVRHPNVIAYNEAFLDGNRLCIIMEYAPDGDLAKVIKKYQLMKRPMPEDLIWKYWIQVARGLSALHSMKILHRDIKPGNIMVMENEVAKIGDLGIAKLLNQSLAAKTQIGTPHYMPPEIWKNRPYSFTSDSWAMGCILYEMATLKVPFEARNLQELRNKVLAGRYPPLAPQYSRELQQMIQTCLDQSPERRPSMDRILSSPSVLSRLDLLPNEGGGVGLGLGPRGGLLDTIKVPKNLQQLKGKLPPAQYRRSQPDAFGQVDEEGEEEESYDAGMVPVNAAALPAIAQRAGYSQAPPQQPSRGGGYGMPMVPQGPPPQGGGGKPLPMGGGGRLATDAVRAGRAAIDGPGSHEKPPPPSYAPKPNPGLKVNVNHDPPGYEWRLPQPSAQPSARSNAAYGAFYHHQDHPAAGGGGGGHKAPQSAAAIHAQRALEAARQALASQLAQQDHQKGYNNAYAPHLKPIGVSSPSRGQARLESARGGAKPAPPPWNFRGAVNNKFQPSPSMAATPSIGGPAPPRRYPPSEWASPSQGRHR